MQNKASSTTSFSTDNRWKGYFIVALKKGAQQLQKATNKWSKKTLAASLLLFLTLSSGASICILISSFFKEAESGVTVTPIRLLQNRNRPGERFNHWDRTQKTTGRTTVKDTMSESDPLSNAAPASPASQP